MISRKAILPTLLLSLIAGLGVSAVAAQTQSAKKKPTTSSSGTRRGPKKKSTKRSSKQRGQKAPTADRISEIQTALAKDGSYSGEPSGKWDDSTVAAMKKYQAAHGLNPSGKLDALTLQKLGLGGTTAGVAAPLPPIGSTSRLTSGNSSSISATRQQ
jgi:peptidoglycan hydrolase-like protein with peptidoglycan-binding domain